MTIEEHHMKWCSLLLADRLGKRCYGWRSMSSYPSVVVVNETITVWCKLFFILWMVVLIEMRTSVIRRRESSHNDQAGSHMWLTPQHGSYWRLWSRRVMEVEDSELWGPRYLPGIHKTYTWKMMTSRSGRKSMSSLCIEYVYYGSCFMLLPGKLVYF